MAQIPYKQRTKSHHAADRTYKLRRSGPVEGAEHLEAQPAHTLPKDIDLRKKPYMPSALDQSTLGSCAANAMANDLCFLYGKETGAVFHPSRLALYYDCRVKIEGSPADQDTGVTIADMCKSVQEYHACPEADWPYVVANFAEAPPAKAVADAELHRRFKYLAVPQTSEGIKTALADGFPVICGIEVYPGFETQATAETGVVPMPDPAKERSLGGHAQLLIGASDNRKAFLSLNSWAPSWGIGGCCWIPYAYILDPDLASDFWSPRFFM